ncbi:MAG: N-acetyltransferase [Candidatus Omnitrophica bacterium]|nr:N-acetyltransferase [Candidatus Omnitrophota bacterium]
MKLSLRKADIKDAKCLQNIIGRYAKEDLMLSRSLIEIYENIRDFFVISQGKEILGCCALHICWEDLAEVKALAVEEKAKGKGIGRRLVRAALNEAKVLKVKKVFCLTYIPEFFKQFGFRKIDRAKLPHKIWTECLKCPKFPDCDEQAMMLKI